MSSSSSVEGNKITGVTKIEGDNVLLILDLGECCTRFGTFMNQRHNIAPQRLKTFSGLALVLDDSSTARKIVKEALIKWVSMLLKLQMVKRD